MPITGGRNKRRTGEAAVPCATRSLPFCSTCTEVQVQMNYAFWMRNLRDLINLSRRGQKCWWTLAKPDQGHLITGRSLERCVAGPAGILRSVPPRNQARIPNLVNERAVADLQLLGRLPSVPLVGA